METTGPASEPSKKKSLGRRIGVILLISLVVFVVAFFVWALSGPEGGVRMANEMESYAWEYLEAHNLLNPTEELVAYYDHTLSLNGSEAAILTTERVIYHKQGRTTSLALQDIEDVQHRTESVIGHVIEISSRSGVPLKIEIAPFNQGESFYNALMGLLKKTRSQD